MPKCFFKRTAGAIVAIFMVVVYFFASAVFLYSSKLVAKAAYFVVYETDSIPASAEIISLRGGAGYVTASGEVAFNVYFSQTEAEVVCASVLPEYPNAAIRVYVQYGEFEENEKFLFSTLKVVEGWGQVLKQGVSQQRIKQGLQELLSLLDYRRKQTGDARCGEFFGALDACLDGVVTMQKLRYFQCFAVEKLWGTEKSGII